MGICDLSPTPHAAALTHWIEQGMAGTMRYMARQAARRLEPATIVPGVTRAVVVAKNYYQPDSPPRNGAGRVAKYARGRDYHQSLRVPLDALAAYLRTLGDKETIARAYVDAGPVPERELAQRAGLGWIGKNTMLISPAGGSYFFLAAVLTSLDLAVDPPFEADRCGSCRRCLDACPTVAFPTARVLDSRRCISYLTIEHQGVVEPSLWPAVAPWVFGCDICQAVCPWNEKFARQADDPMPDRHPELEWLDLADLLAMSDDEFTHRYGWTPLERPGADGMRRNARIASSSITDQAS
ncbi:MAG: tRNA epoxyqueuosine(34) reductase QueG [Gemmatimonadota bacterium]|nr:tRNA epoxyqueuosine(34) reductase QueG [Gemmatimonadota bacterium]MDH3476923.1 tRNA epoxyqueuosine(34) reductase QueG [Gemmatimonadota bacterium]MDH5548273.1 tRNA epoxyqueuosine(34) reductase QueG [Gemmatimonadota bacterium]